MVVTSKHRTHKVMEAAIRELMGAGTPPRFKFKDTYASIEFPSGYTIPAQATLEAKYDELLALEEGIQKTVMEGDLEVGTSNLFVDTQTGNIGIGTDSPAYTLDVHGSSNVGALTTTSISGDGSGLTSLNAGNVSSGTLGTDRIPNLSATKITSGTLTRPISTTTGTFSGDVGIGTTNPLSELDIYNPAGTELIVSRNAGSSVNPTIRLWNFDDNNYNNHAVGTSVGTINFSGNERLNGDTHTDNSRAFSYANTLYDWARISALFAGSSDSATTSTGYVRGDLAFYTNNGDGATSDLQERMRIKHNGNVGIGVTSPGIVLDVGSSLSNPQIGRNYATGSVHDADKRDAIYFGRWDGTGRDFLGIKCRVDTHTALGYGDYSNQTKLEFHTWGNNYASSREVMCIRGDGNVGIGTASPGFKLEVNGTMRHNGLSMSSGTTVDQLTTITKSLTITAAWMDTGIKATNLATGTYIVQIYNVSDHGSGGLNYEETYSGIMSWYAGNTNSTEATEIPLTAAGHAPNDNHIYLRVMRTLSADTNNLKLQIRKDTSMSSAYTYTFKFRRMI